MLGLQKAKRTAEVFQRNLDPGLSSQFLVKTQLQQILLVKDTVLTTMQKFQPFSTAKIQTAASSSEVMPLFKLQLISIYSDIIFPECL